jgi:signal recognition particle subunit SRP54
VFEGLGDRLQRVFKELRGEGSLTEFHLDSALREIRLSLLEADVALPVVKGFVGRVREQAIGRKVATALSPAQEVTRIVRDELTALLGGQRSDLDLGGRPAVIALVGLQGSGKTTSAAKLALHLKEKRGQHPLLVPADLSRPAAVAQLKSLGRRVGVPVLDTEGETDPVAACRRGVEEARLTGRDVVLLDTAGRLHIDDGLMKELGEVCSAVQPGEILFVADAMTGQDAVRSAAAFDATLDLTGAIFTKTDGDSRGGAALSIVSSTGRPIKFVGTGEKVEDLEPFFPDRMASRILGLGDVLTLIEKVEEQIDAKEAARLARKAARAEFTLEDLRDQLRAMQKMGPVSQMLDFLPRVGPFRSLKGIGDIDEKALVRVAAIIDSMTANERRYPQIINGSRKKRISRGSGVGVPEINRLLKQHAQMKKMMKSLGRGMAGFDMSKLPLPAPKE